MAAEGRVSAELQAAIDAVRAFIEDELAAVRALYLEDDEAVYRAAMDRAAAHLDGPEDDPVELRFGRPAGSGAFASDAAARARAEQQRPRVLMAVTRHEGEGRTVFRAIVSDLSDPEGDSYGIALHVADVGGTLKIVGQASVDPFAPADRLVWEAAAGDQLPDAGPPVEAARFKRPIIPAQAAHFDALPEP